MSSEGSNGGGGASWDNEEEMEQEMREIFNELLNFDNIYMNNREMDRQMGASGDDDDFLYSVRNIWEELNELVSTLSNSSSSSSEESPQNEAAGGALEVLDPILSSLLSELEPAEGPNDNNNNNNNEESNGI